MSGYVTPTSESELHAVLHYLIRHCSAMSSMTKEQRKRLDDPAASLTLEDGEGDMLDAYLDGVYVASFSAPTVGAYLRTVREGRLRSTN